MYEVLHLVIKEMKGQKGLGQRSREVKVNGQGKKSRSILINVKEKAGGLMPTSSCFIVTFIESVTIDGRKNCHLI